MSTFSATLAALGFSLTSAAPSHAQAETGIDDLEDISLEALLNSETTVASATATKLRETPGIITVVTRDEMLRAGVRDLVDILQLVPGFNFAHDVQSSVGVGFRGIWGQEGKVLVLWDGHEMNETLYLTPQFGNMYPIDAIDKVEIIRGPGSALYGGSAELAVINIVPRGAALNGIQAVTRLGQMTRSFGHALGQFSYGQRSTGLLDGLELSFDAYAGEGVLSDRVYDDGYGTTYRMDWESQASSPTWVSGSASYKGLQLRLLASAFRQRTRDGFSVAPLRTSNNNFHGLYADLRYELKVTEGLTLTPRLNWKRQLPWNAATFPAFEEVPSSDYYNKQADRTRAQLVASLDLVQNVNVVLGVDGYIDDAQVLYGSRGEPVGLNTPFFNGQTSIQFWNIAAFGQAMVQTSVINVTAGARFENHSQYGPSFVPRVAVTRAWERLHAKVLVSGAFKAPGIENININPDIAPERTRVLEGEIGYEMSERMAFAANIFDVDVHGPIVYFTDESTEGYVNSPKTGSRGAELELRMREEWGSLYLTYSFASTEDKNAVKLYTSPDPSVLLGFPAHKITANMSLRLTDKLTVTPTAILLSERYGWAGSATGAAERVSPTALLNAAVTYEDLYVAGLDLTLAVYNALDVDYRYLQAYDGGKAPLPARSREVFARFAYELPL